MHRPGERIIDGKRLETLWLAPAQPERPTIVMLHEGLGSVALWKDFPHRLAGRTSCGVFVYSRYGHGSSDRLVEKRTVDYMHHEAEIVLPLLLTEAGIERPILLGHSDGGSIALTYAGKYPDSPRALILEAPHVFVEDLSVKSIAEAKAAYQTTDLPSWVATTSMWMLRSGAGTISGWTPVSAPGTSNPASIRSGVRSW